MSKIILAGVAARYVALPALLWSLVVVLKLGVVIGLGYAVVAFLA